MLVMVDYVRGMTIIVYGRKQMHVTLHLLSVLGLEEVENGIPGM